MERPQKPYLDLFDEKGISYEQAAGALTVRGTLTPGVPRELTIGYWRDRME